MSSGREISFRSRGPAIWRKACLVPALDDAVADHDQRHPSATQLLVLLERAAELCSMSRLGVANAVGGKKSRAILQ